MEMAFDTVSNAARSRRSSARRKASRLTPPDATRLGTIAPPLLLEAAAGWFTRAASI